MTFRTTSPGRTLALLPLLLTLSACASLEFVDPSSGGTSDTDLPDLSPEDTLPDLPDTEPDPCEGMTPVCTPGRYACSEDRSQVLRCDTTCPVVTDTVVLTCGEQQICDTVSDSATCRACIPGECGPIYDECLPDTPPVCISWGARATCTILGEYGPSEPCRDGARCVGGTCNAGLATGSLCTRHDQCEGRFCVCAPNSYVPLANSNDCSTPFNLGFCSVQDCLQDGCRPGELCVDFADTIYFQRRALCVPWSGCIQRGLLCPGGDRGLICEELPTRREPGGPRTWELGCFRTTTPHVGDACTSNQLCLGGTCMRRNDYPDESTASYCTATCTSSSECPSFSSCATPPGSTLAYCLQHEDSCTRADSTTAEDTNIITLSVTSTEGETVEVCWMR